MRYSNLASVLLVILFLSLPSPASAHGTHNCDWGDATTVLTCLHETKHKINDIWDKVLETWKGVVQGGKDTLFGTVKEIDAFLKGVESSFNTAKRNFDTITGTTLDSIEQGVAAVQPVIEDEFFGAQAFLGTDPGGCGPGSGCAVFRQDLKDFLLELNTLSFELGDFYNSLPADSPLVQVQILYNAVDYLPGYFLYPMARAMQELDLAFPYYSDVVSDLTADILVLKQAVTGEPLSSSGGLAYHKAVNRTVSSYGSTEASFNTCAFIDNNRTAVEHSKKTAYGLTLGLKALGIAFRAKSRTIVVDTSIEAFGTVGKRVRVDKAGLAGTIITGIADASLAVLGATTTKVHYCDLLLNQNGLDSQLVDLSNILNGLDDLTGLSGSLANIDGKLDSLKTGQVALGLQLGVLGSKQTDIASQLTGLGVQQSDIASQLTGLGSQHSDIAIQVTDQVSGLSGQLDSQTAALSSQVQAISAQLDYIQRCFLVNGKKPADC